MSAPARIRILTSLSDIPPAQWDGLAHAANAPGEPGESPREHADSVSEVPDSSLEEDRRNPFIQHAFLSALERSGSVGGRTGWQPRHIIAEDASGLPVGAVPAYVKAHSRGEYVFDHAFAEAWHRAGGSYYPKVQVSVPFTPATGRRLLVLDGAHGAAVRTALIGGLEALREHVGASSTHATFLTARDRDSFLDAGYLLRNDQQFHFANRGYRSFEDFLATLRSDKRKVLRRERREALANGISVEWLTGADITEAHWDAFFAFYIDTGSRKWGSPYLTRMFFSLIGETMAADALLVLARRDGRCIAGALNFVGANTIYGRHWGAIEQHPFLHFELCYYQAIDFAIARGLARVEAGAQGEHKLARGYEPVKTVSVHRFADPGFQKAVADYLARERRAVDQAQLELEAILPFRRSQGENS